MLKSCPISLLGIARLSAVFHHAVSRINAGVLNNHSRLLCYADRIFISSVRRIIWLRAFSNGVCVIIEWR